MKRAATEDHIEMLQKRVKDYEEDLQRTEKKLDECGVQWTIAEKKLQIALRMWKHGEEYNLEELEERFDAACAGYYMTSSEGEDF